MNLAGLTGAALVPDSHVGRRLALAALIDAAEPTELLDHFGLEQRRPEHLQDTVVDPLGQGVGGHGGGHGHQTREDWTAVGAMPWVMA
jgi:hypothetical protein